MLTVKKFRCPGDLVDPPTRRGGESASTFMHTRVPRLAPRGDASAVSGLIQPLGETSNFHIRKSIIQAAACQHPWRSADGEAGGATTKAAFQAARDPKTARHAWAKAQFFRQGDGGRPRLWGREPVAVGGLRDILACGWIMAIRGDFQRDQLTPAQTQTSHFFPTFIAPLALAYGAMKGSAC